MGQPRPVANDGEEFFDATRGRRRASDGAAAGATQRRPSLLRRLVSRTKGHHAEGAATPATPAATAAPAAAATPVGRKHSILGGSRNRAKTVDNKSGEAGSPKSRISRLGSIFARSGPEEDTAAVAGQAERMEAVMAATRQMATDTACGTDFGVLEESIKTRALTISDEGQLQMNPMKLFVAVVGNRVALRMQNKQDKQVSIDRVALSTNRQDLEFLRDDATAASMFDIDKLEYFVVAFNPTQTRWALAFSSAEHRDAVVKVHGLLRSSLPVEDEFAKQLRTAVTRAKTQMNKAPDADAAARKEGDSDSDSSGSPRAAVGFD